MLTTVPAVVEKGQIKLLEPILLQAGQRLLVTFLTTDEMRFWLEASQSTLTEIWDNEEDDVYAELLEG